MNPETENSVIELEKTPEYTEVAENIDDTDFINDENVNAFKLLNLKSKMKDIESVMTSINNSQKNLLGDNEEFDPIDEALNNVTEEELNEMTPEQIDEFLIDEEGDPVEFAIDFDGDEDKMNEFKKEFIILRKQALTSFEKFDEELAKINEEIAASQEEFDKFVNMYGNVTNLIRHRIEERLETAETDEKKELFTKILTSFNNGMNLDNIKAYCKSPRGKNILGDFYNEKRSHYIYRSYLKVAKSLDIKTDLTSFVDLEKKFIPEYTKRPNLFVYTIIHYIASMHNKNYTKADGLFITQFTVNLKNLFYDKFDTPEDKETFINNIIEVFKIIG